jgi:hypothetical protein
MDVVYCIIDSLKEKLMKKKLILLVMVCAFCVLGVLLFNGCVDPVSLTTIKIVNKSSYDLHISFYPYPGIKMEEVPADRWDNDFDLIKNQSVSFELTGSELVYRDPNYEIEKVLFFNINNDEEIKEYNNNDHNLFKLSSSKTEPSGRAIGTFILEIDDDLLK